MITKELYQKSREETWGHLSISSYLLSACCRAPVQDCAGVYDSFGIMDGYECTKCGEHIWELEKFIPKK